MEQSNNLTHNSMHLSNAAGKSGEQGHLLDSHVKR